MFVSTARDSKVKAKHASTLARWAYSDGTVFYLDMTEAELASGRRAALGPMVYRMADGSDALCEDCIGPSLYQKAQGTPVRVWGLLVKGKLNITVLAEEHCMNRWRYAWIIKHRFPDWLDGCDKIVQDYEKCLRCAEPLAEMAALDISVLEEHPKYGQDLNAIENAWKLLRDRLYITMPTHLERREDFIPRLWNAVRWINANQHKALLYLCNNQKERAAAVALNGGGRTKW